MTQSIPRKESWLKVTGEAKYTDDGYPKNMLYAKLVTSEIAHGTLKAVDTGEAEKSPGVKAVLTGKTNPRLFGVVLEDRPLLAIDKVRYYGEPVALVVAETEREAAYAARLVKADYAPLPVLHMASQSIASGAPLIHENPDGYVKMVKDVYPCPGSNIASSYAILKGNMDDGWAQSPITVEERFYLPPSDHAAMETRAAKVEILADGTVRITTSSQSPYKIKEVFSQLFDIEEGKILVHVPFVGGAFGGKAPVQLELLAYIASKAVGGRLVRLANSREEDMAASPSRLGMEATIRLGAAMDGRIQAADMTYLLDTGAYTDISPYMTKATAINCTGPYHIENVSCKALCVYTNHTYATSFRGFSHESFTFCVERAMDRLALRLGMDPLELRRKNAIRAGDFSPTQVKITASNTGDISECITRLKTLIHWDEGVRMEMGGHKVRAKGMSCFWKSPTSPTDACAGAVITFNQDGSVNLNTGVIEMGSEAKNLLARILAERMKMNVNRIHVNFEVDTQTSPKYWKTVGSMSGYLAGRAVMNAAEDAICQLKNLASIALRSPVEDLDVENEAIFLRHLPEYKIGFQDLVYGLSYPDGNAIGGPIIGRGSFIMHHLSLLDEQTGKGNPSPAWTVGAQAVEVELDTREYTYRLLKAASVLDVGHILDQNLTDCTIRSGMSMGLGLATREEFTFDGQGILQDTSLRTYKLLHIGQEPEYLTDYVQTPQMDAPYGIRAVAEHGVIGMPAALANALSAAALDSFNFLPLTPEKIWRQCQKL